MSPRTPALRADPTCKCTLLGPPIADAWQAPLASDVALRELLAAHHPERATQVSTRPGTKMPISGYTRS
jgi:hypothetical protein